jgi:caspase domain-containing protein
MRLRLTLLLLLAPALLASAQTRRALLIGIDTYQPAGTVARHTPGCAYGRCELGSFQNLEGAVNDAQSMADLLTSPKFAFPAANVALLTNPAPPQPRPGVVVLPAEQTSRDGILAAMQHYLVDLPQPGDTVVFYDASHGSLRINSQGNKITVLVNGRYLHADSTLVPSDAYLGGFDVRDREMTRIFNAALDKGVHLTVIFDSCHSGGATRGASQLYRARALPFDSRDAADPPELLPNRQPLPAPTERPGNPALVFSAAQQDQEADEAEPTPAQPEAHGAFTAALLEALETLPADAPAALVYQRVKAVLEGSSLNQEPDLDATPARRRLPLFAPTGATTAAPTPLRTAALTTTPTGAVWLDTGRVAGIGVGSEFTSALNPHASPTTAPGAAPPTILRITALQGIARSSAQIVSPAHATVAPGEIFSLTKWVPADSAPLRLWLPAALPHADLLAAAAQITASQIALISDPAEDPFTDMLSWDGARWLLQHFHPAPASSTPIDLTRHPVPPIDLGPRLTAAALHQHLAPDARLWANLPPSRELAARLALHDPDSAVQLAPDLASATYLLAGSLTDDAPTPTYAWLLKSAFDAGPPPPPIAAPKHSPGCSASSSYPTRTDWVPLTIPAPTAPAPTQLDTPAAALNHYASLLAKVHGWIQLADNPTGASADAYYSLALVSAKDHSTPPTPGHANPQLTLLPPNQPARQDDQIQLALHASAPIAQRRWVYVLDIDCHGKGSLLYPRDYAENQFPSDADTALDFVLPGSPTLRIGPPYGIDTLVMLSTAQPLPDPYALEFEGVATRGAATPASPLQRLLTDTSRASRGAPTPIPTDWGLTLTTLHSIPNPAP